MSPASGSKLLRVHNMLLVTEVNGGFPEQGLSQHMVSSKSKSACSYSSSSPETFNYLQEMSAQPEQKWMAFQSINWVNATEVLA